MQSQSTLGLHFGPIKCPQCREAIGTVQKLYLSDQPNVAPSQAHSSTPSFISPWQQLRLCLGYIATHICLTFQLLKQVAVKKCQDLTEITLRLLTQAKLRSQHCYVTLQREWYDLSDTSRFLVIAAMVLILAFVMQDIQQDRGIYACVVAPMVQLVFDIFQQIIGAAAFLVFRSIMVLVNCGLEIFFGLIEMVYAVLEMFALVLFDFVCVPWVLLAACTQLISALVSGLFGFIQRVVTSCLICLSVCFVISMIHEEWQTVFSDLALAMVDWVLRQLPEERAVHREGVGAESGQDGRKIWQHRLAELVRAAMIVLQRELRHRRVARREEAIAEG